MARPWPTSRPTTPPTLREEEPGLTGFGTVPGFAIGQRSLLLRTDDGNVMWDGISLLDDATVAAITDLGGIDTICCSHPHFYGSIVEYRRRVRRPHPHSRRRSSMGPASLRSHRVLRRRGGLGIGRDAGAHRRSLRRRCRGALGRGADGKGALLTGDTITVVMDRRWVSFMWSYPNLIPLDAGTILAIADRVGRFRFDRIYGGWWGRIVIADGAEAVRRSAERYVARIQGPGATGVSPPCRRPGARRGRAARSRPARRR